MGVIGAWNGTKHSVAVKSRLNVQYLTIGCVQVQQVKCASRILGEGNVSFMHAEKQRMVSADKWPSAAPALQIPNPFGLCLSHAVDAEITCKDSRCCTFAHPTRQSLLDSKTILLRHKYNQV